MRICSKKVRHGLPAHGPTPHPRWTSSLAYNAFADPAHRRCARVLQLGEGKPGSDYPRRVGPVRPAGFCRRFCISRHDENRFCTAHQRKTTEPTHHHGRVTGPAGHTPTASGKAPHPLARVGRTPFPERERLHTLSMIECGSK